MDQSESANLLRSRLRPISHCYRGYGHSKMKMPPFSRYGDGGKHRRRRAHKSSDYDDDSEKTKKKKYNKKDIVIEKITSNKKN